MRPKSFLVFTLLYQIHQHVFENKVSLRLYRANKTYWFLVPVFPSSIFARFLAHILQM